MRSGSEDYKLVQIRCVGSGRSGQRRHQVACSCVGACLRSSASGHYPLGCPIFVNLMLLRRDGWQHARVEVGKHDTLCADKLIVNRDLHKRPAYLDCLRALPMLAQAEVRHVWACQLGAYYQALMTVGDKRKVQPHKSAGFYRALRSPGRSTHALDPEHRPVGEGDVDPLGAPSSVGLATAAPDVVGSLSGEESDAGLVLLRRRPAATLFKGRKAPRCKVVDDSSDEGEGEGAVEACASPIGSLASVGGSAPNAGAPIPPPVPGDGGDDVSSEVEGRIVRRAGFVRMTEGLPSMADGVHIEEEMHNEGLLGAYHRLIARCPLSRNSHACGLVCCKKRDLRSLGGLGVLGSMDCRGADLCFAKRSHGIQAFVGAGRSLFEAAQLGMSSLGAPASLSEP